MRVDWEADKREYGLYRFALDEGGGMLDGVSLNGVRDRNRLLRRDVFGVFHGTPTWARDGIVGSYLTTGNNKYVDTFGRIIQPGTTVSFSVALWLKLNSSFGNFPLVVSEMQSGTNIGWGVELFTSTPNHGAPYAIAYDGTHQINNYSSSIPAIEDSLWHLVVAIWNRITQTLKISVDVGTEFSTSISTVGSMNGDATAELKIGQNANLPGTDGFVGGIHDVRLYRGVILNTQDRLRLYLNKKMRKAGPDLYVPAPWEFQPIAVAGGGSNANRAITIIG